MRYDDSCGIHHALEEAEALTEPKHKFVLMMIPGLILMTINMIHIGPPNFLLPGGHPNVSYYPYSFLHWAYSDVVALYGARRLFLHTIPYFQNIIEYPVLIGLYMSAMSWLPGFWGYFIGSGLGLMAAFVGALYLLRQTAGEKAAWWFTFSPLLLVFGMLNWDMLGLLTWGLTIAAWRKQRWFHTGLFLGLGVVTKFFPVVLLPYMVASLYQKDHRTHLKQFLWGFVLTGIGINLPFALFAEEGWSEFFTFNSGRGPDPGIYQWLFQMGILHIDTVNLLSAVLTLAGGLVFLALLWQGKLDAVEAGTAALSWWFLCNKVYSPQYMLWVYYAILWVDVNIPLLLTANAAGLLDFGLAMRWLALGTTNSPFLQQFVDTVPAPIIAFRDLTLLATAIMPWARHRAKNVRLTHKLP
ncbi:glycosyltransferase family 87 protein [Sulfobacillus thermosulfidooxidans]|uniref:glycosyltransferase family 87 protein n=1 Tax=Sulfobacillus thermosulfidooxidans TaxID=28034 RepID=UPI000409CF7B|nr:glycosyltransferase family 87 protein [Sulfobacillus thermosulfidooxidans]